MPRGCRWPTLHLLWAAYYGLLTIALLTMAYQPYLLWLQVAYLDCYAMRFVKPPAAAAAGAVATSDLPPLPLQYSLGAEKARPEWNIKPN